MPPSPSHPGYFIQFPNGISGLDSNGNYTEFRPIPELSDHHVTLTLTRWLLYPIPEQNSGNCVERELDGIPTDFGFTQFRNRMEFRFDPTPEFPELMELMELIPRAELIPQCSTLRNRMTAPDSCSPKYFLLKTLNSIISNNREKLVQYASLQLLSCIRK
jgi:hypothetical protein